MKNLFLTFFTFTVLNTVAQEDFDYYNFNGHWITEGSVYELIILYNEEDGFEFLNFSLSHGRMLDEKILSYINGKVKTKSINHKNNWNIQNVYEMISNDKLKVTLTGDYNGTIMFKRLY